MDLVDRVSYGEYEVEKELAMAYRDVFNGTDASEIVMRDLMKHCLWGLDTNDPNVQPKVFHRSAIIHHIKKMLNGEPTEFKDENNQGE